MHEQLLSQNFQSRHVEAMLDIPRATLLWTADRLHVTRHGRAGKARQWTTKDIAVIYIAQRFAERGISQAASFDLANAVEKKFVDIVVEEEAEGAKYFLVALLVPDEIGRHDAKLTKDPLEALKFIESGGVAIFNVTELISEALGLVLAHLQAQEAEDE